MVLYNKNELYKRSIILQSQLQFGKFLTTDIVNTLVSLFDDSRNTYTDKISKYLRDERINRGLRNDNVFIRGEVYGNDDNNSTLYLEIRKHGKLFLHLSIHLSLTKLTPADAGMIHIYKNIYEYEFPSKRQIKKIKSYLYALIEVKKPMNFPNSLIFNIADGYNTPATIPAIQKYDKELQAEMDAIISVLNSMFDETNTKLYVSNNVNKLPIHAKINNILNNINKHNIHYTRKNKGSRMFQNTTSFGNITHINMSKYKTKTKQNPTRKISITNK